jgi:hypothetical protein
MSKTASVRAGMCLAVIVLLFASVKNTYAIPAFARKYKTSCATCHNGFPKMNAFGEAFRRNGYQFPGHGDAEAIKEEPVSLGSEGNKRAFPDAIWPGTIPGSSPLSLFLNGEIAYNPKEEPRYTFGGLGSSIEAIAGGTLGEDLSFWGQTSLGDEGLELNRVFIIFSNIIGDSYALNARVGVFEPGLFSFSTHRAWMEGYWFTTRPFSDDMGWTFEETQKGIELNGMAKGRFGYSAGIVEGFGSPHSNKDYYAHVTYKFCGMPLDGVVEEVSAVGGSQPYVDNSVTVGAFAYAGNAVLGDGAAMQENKFTVFGGDFNAFYDRCNLFGGIGIRHDDQPFLGEIGTSANTTTWFTELDVTVFPWLLPGVRFESWNSHMIDEGTGEVVSYTDSQIAPGVVFLIRANLKAVLTASFARQESLGNSKFEPGQVLLFLSVGI